MIVLATLRFTEKGKMMYFSYTVSFILHFKEGFVLNKLHYNTKKSSMFHLQLLIISDDNDYHNEK